MWNSLCLSVAGRVNPMKIILMLQLLYVLHNSPVLVPLKTFRIVNSLFRMPIWKNRPPRIKLEHLQCPKDEGGLALPNPWLDYLAAQLEHLIGVMSWGTEQRGANGRSSETVMLHTVKGESVPVALEALAFGKPHKIYSTYNLIQKVCNKYRE